MSAEYSVEEVLSAMDEAAYALEFLPGDDGIAAKIRLQKARAAFAKRIKADEGAHKPTPFAFYDSDRKTFFWFDDRVGAPVKTSGTVNLFTYHATIAQNAEDSKRLKALEQAMDEASSEDFESFSGTCVDRLKERADEIMRGENSEVTP